MSDTTATDATATDAAVFEFPFEVPADLSTATAAELAALQDQIREHTTPLRGVSPAEATDETVAALHAYAALARQVVAADVALRDRDAQTADAFADLDDALADFTAPAEPADPSDDEDDGTTNGEDDDEDDAEEEPAPTPAAVTAATRRTAPPARRAAPRVRDVARRTGPAQLPPEERRRGSLTASVDLAGFSTGQTLERFEDAARLLSARLDQYTTPAPARPRGPWPGNRRPITVYSGEGRRLTMTQYARHAGVQIRHDFPDDLRVREADEGRGYEVALHAASERRLPGGSLIESMRQQVKRGKSLTAAAGWCAPSDIMYDLCELESSDGVLDSPELQTTRGGWQIPENGGPDFATIFDAIGNSGDTHLTEAEVIADTSKVCTDIPCPDFDDVRLGVDYVCLTGGLLQRRGYPEVVARWSRAALTALAHKMNQGYIAAIVAASGNEIIIPADPSGDDAVSGLLSAVEIAIEDIRTRNRMAFNSTIEVVLPHWALVPMRAALARRTGVALYNVSNAQLLDAFTSRGAVPRFVYDWQDAGSGLATGPGGATALTALPGTVQFLAYPAGTWVKAVQDVVNLDTVYDSTKLATNEYTAIFVETGWAALKTCPVSRLYTARVDPSGVVACCPGEEVS